MSAMANPIMGAHDCPCIPMDKVTNTTCFNKEWVGSFVGRTIPFESGCLESDFGIGCGKHFLDIPDLCDDENVLDNPFLCDTNWCFIDEEKCFFSNETFAKVRYTSDEYPFKHYSITTCGDSFGKQNFFNRENPLDGADLHVVVPTFMWPYYFVTSVDDRESDDINYDSFNETHKIEGVLVDFLHDIKRKTLIRSIKFIGTGWLNDYYREKSDLIGIKYVRRNIVDLSIAPLIQDAADLKECSFTMPILEFDYFIYEFEKKENEGNPLGYGFKKMFGPFSSHLCYTLVISVLFVAVVNICVSGPFSDFASWYQKLHDDKWKKSNNLKRLSIFARIQVTSFVRSFNECFGNASEIEENFSVPHKIVAFGFGFFILIITSSYTANLATFLSYTRGATYISSMEQAIDDKVKICVNKQMLSILQEKYKNALFIPTDFLRPGTALEQMKSKKCDVLASNELELLTIPDLCSENLITNNVLVFTSSLAMPIKASYKRVFDEGVFTTKSSLPYLMAKYTKNVCVPGSPVKQISHSTLNIIDLIGPILILLLCIVIGVLIKMRSIIHQIRSDTKYHKKNDEVRPDESSQYRSTYNGSNGAKKFYDDSFLTEAPAGDDYYDLLEYKYQLELIHAQVELAQGFVENKLGNREDIIDHQSF